MPRRPQNPSPRSSESARPIQVDSRNILQQVREFCLAPRTRIVCGIILLAIAFLLLLSYISYFFTGSSDYSILELDRPERRAARLEIRNWLGLPGAAISRWLIDGTFGIVSGLFISMLTLYGLKLVKFVHLNGLRIFLHSIFWLLWGSITLGFLQLITGIAGFFRWGGAHGEVISIWLNSYIQPIGLTVLLLVTLGIYAVVADPNFVSHCRALWAKLKELTARKPKEPEQQEQPEQTDQPELTDQIELTDTPSAEDIITIDLTPSEEDNDDDNDNDNDDNNENVTLTFENASQDALNASSDALNVSQDTLNASQDALNASPDADADADLDINATEAVELTEDDPEYILKTQGPFDPRKDLENYRFPSLDLLKVYPNETAPVIDQEEQQANANRIVTTLRNYGIEIESIKATVGPTVTLYEVVPKTGTRINKIQALENDIMMSLAATGIRIIAPIPGKSAVGIEVPNEKPQTVSMHSVIASKRFQEEQKMRLPIAIGRTITNEVFMFDLAKTPHLLVAGATGQGKSVAINAIITSLLYKKHPAEMKLVMVDPKMVEFAPYKPLIRHYLAAMPDVDPEQVVITECDRVVNTLNSLVIEMENRYKLLMDAGVRNLEDYNDKFIARKLNPAKVVADNLHHQYLPYIVIIIDEYGDFIMQAGKQVETPIARITQKARAVGMHMILATQRPSVNIVTGVIKANIPTRIALRTQSVIDSRTVLDVKGAEQLIGRGDMLYAGNGNVTRIQCAFVDTPEVDQIVDHIKVQQHYFEPYQLPEYIGEGQEEALAPGSVDMKKLDPMFADVARYVVSKQEGSTSRLQRAFEIGYNRAGKLSDQLEAAGIVGPNKGPKGRDVLIQDLTALDTLLSELGC